MFLKSHLMMSPIFVFIYASRTASQPEPQTRLNLLPSVEALIWKKRMGELAQNQIKNFPLTYASITQGGYTFTTIIPINQGDGVTSLTAIPHSSELPKYLRGNGIVWN